MKIFFTSDFRKKFNNLPIKIQKQFAGRIDLFQGDFSHPSLKVHPLKGNLAGLRSFAVSSDYRVIFRILDGDSIELISIGTHSQLY